MHAFQSKWNSGLTKEEKKRLAKFWQAITEQGSKNEVAYIRLFFVFVWCRFIQKAPILHACVAPRVYVVSGSVAWCEAFAFRGGFWETLFIMYVHERELCLFSANFQRLCSVCVVLYVFLSLFILILVSVWFSHFIIRIIHFWWNTSQNLLSFLSLFLLCDLAQRIQRRKDSFYALSIVLFSSLIPFEYVVIFVAAAATWQQSGRYSALISCNVKILRFKQHIRWNWQIYYRFLTPASFHIALLWALFFYRYASQPRLTFTWFWAIVPKIWWLTHTHTQ